MYRKWRLEFSGAVYCHTNLLPLSLGVRSTQSPTSGPNTRTAPPAASPYVAVKVRERGVISTRNSPSANHHVLSSWEDGQGGV